MIGVVVFTHGELGSSLIRAVELIAGPQEQVRAAGLHHGDGVTAFEENCRRMIREVDTGDGVLIFVDFLGGTPSNIALQCSAEEKKSCITGVNMPMLIDALTRRDEFSLEELAEHASETGHRGICRPDTLAVQMEHVAEEEF